MFRTTTSLFTDGCRGSVPPMIVAVVMVLQRLEGCSDREAVDRFAFDVRREYAAGGVEFDYPGFVHTVLVDMRARLAGSKRPDRIFDVTFVVAEASMVYLARRSLAAECDGAAVAAAQSALSQTAPARSTFTVEAVSRAPNHSAAWIQPLATSSLSRDCGRPWRQPQRPTQADSGGVRSSARLGKLMRHQVLSVLVGKGPVGAG